MRWRHVDSWQSRRPMRRRFWASSIFRIGFWCDDVTGVRDGRRHLRFWTFWCVPGVRGVSLWYIEPLSRVEYIYLVITSLLLSHITPQKVAERGWSLPRPMWSRFRFLVMCWPDRIGWCYNVISNKADNSPVIRFAVVSVINVIVSPGLKSISGVSITWVNLPRGFRILHLVLTP